MSERKIRRPNNNIDLSQDQTVVTAYIPTALYKRLCVVTNREGITNADLIQAGIESELARREGGNASR